MSDKNTGGRAFPAPTTKPLENYYPGMTLRDYFAGQALVSTNLGIGVAEEFYSRTAEHCYALADALLKARDA